MQRKTCYILVVRCQNRSSPMGIDRDLGLWFPLGSSRSYPNRHPELTAGYKDPTSS